MAVVNEILIYMGRILTYFRPNAKTASVGWSLCIAEEQRPGQQFDLSMFGFICSYV
jgi:hypothetical protein